MNKIRLLLVVSVLICFVLAAGPVLAEETVSYPFRGVTFTQKVVTSPRPLKTYIVEIDLTDPGISAFVTPSNGAANCEVDSRRTSEFSGEFGTQIAINGSFYAWCGSSGVWDIRGISASMGDVYSEGDGFWLLNINAENWPSMALSVVPGDVYNAVAGDYWLLVSNGVRANTAGWPTGRHPRTAVGYTQDRQTLILCVIDGRQTGVSEGVDFDELTLIMQELGAWDALNLDGGGSSTLVFNDDAPVVQNVPSDAGGERLVANHLGIYIDPDVEPWWGPTAFEDDFDDNYFDPAMWEEFSGGAGYVIEQNQRLEFHECEYARPAVDFSAYYKITGRALASGVGGGAGPEMSIKFRSDGGALGWCGTPTGVKISYWPEWDDRGAMHLQSNYEGPGELYSTVLLWPLGQDSPHDFNFEAVDTGEFVSLYIEDSANADNNCELTLHGFDNPIYDYGDYIYIGATCGNMFYDDVVIQMPRTVSDFDENEKVNFSDFAVMAAAWLSDPADPEWNSDCDISDPSDDIINLLDFCVFVEQWLWQAPPSP